MLGKFCSWFPNCKQSAASCKFTHPSSAEEVEMFEKLTNLVNECKFCQFYPKCKNTKCKKEHPSNDDQEKEFKKFKNKAYQIQKGFDKQ